MVRLKVYIDFINCCYITIISIPYGAIKSSSSKKEVAGNIYISIPYGAIKRSPLKSNTPISPNFNSLWCD